MQGVDRRGNHVHLLGVIQLRQGHVQTAMYRQRIVEGAYAAAPPSVTARGRVRRHPYRAQPPGPNGCAHDPPVVAATSDSHATGPRHSSGGTSVVGTGSGCWWQRTPTRLASLSRMLEVASNPYGGSGGTSGARSRTRAVYRGRSRQLQHRRKPGTPPPARLGPPLGASNTAMQPHGMQRRGTFTVLHGEGRRR